MVEELLNNIGIKNRATRFVKPPTTTYAVWFDSVSRRGTDQFNCISEHTYTIELYSYKPDPVAESKIEAALDSIPVEYEKDDREYLDSEQMYEVIYTFTIVKKEGY